MIDGQYDGVRHFPGRNAQGHAGTHAVGPGLVGRSGHDSPFRGVSSTADNDRLARKLRPAEHFDRCDELVEINMQHPRDSARAAA
ncbi:hypothetical protein GCM10027405_00700 [Arthrobacter alkaliphilus]